MGHPGLREVAEDGEAGDRYQRQIERVAEAFGGGESDTNSGERAGAVDYCDDVERGQREAGAGGEIADGGDEALGGGTAGEGRGGEDLGGVGEGDGAGGAAGVYEEGFHPGNSGVGHFEADRVAVPPPSVYTTLLLIVLGLQFCIYKLTLILLGLRRCIYTVNFLPFGFVPELLRARGLDCVATQVSDPNPYFYLTRRPA
jgi:hypothetical protein